MEELYRRGDTHGNLLDIRSTDEGNAAKVTVSDRDGGATVFVGPLAITGITRAMWVACGQLPPLILERPDVPEGEPWRPRPGSSLSAAVDGNRVREMWLEGPSLSMTAAETRRHAAALAVLADRADAEPDPGDVDELAAAIRSGLYPDSERIGLRPGESDRVAARTALRWMRDREARNA